MRLEFNPKDKSVGEIIVSLAGLLKKHSELESEKRKTRAHINDIQNGIDRCYENLNRYRTASATLETQEKKLSDLEKNGKSKFAIAMARRNLAKYRKSAEYDMEGFNSRIETCEGTLKEYYGRKGNADKKLKDIDKNLAALDLQYMAQVTIVKMLGREQEILNQSNGLLTQWDMQAGAFDPQTRQNVLDLMPNGFLTQKVKSYFAAEDAKNKSAREIVK